MCVHVCVCVRVCACVRVCVCVHSNGYRQLTFLSFRPSFGTVWTNKSTLICPNKCVWRRNQRGGVRKYGQVDVFLLGSTVWFYYYRVLPDVHQMVLNDM